MTHEGGLLAFDLGNLAEALNQAKGEFPAFLDVSVKRAVAAVDGALTLKVGGEGRVKGGDASIHMEKGVAKMVLLMDFIGLKQQTVTI